MYEYRSRPNYHRPWHKRVHAFVEPPVIPIRRRTQSVDPLRRWSTSLVSDGESNNRYQNEPKHSNNNSNDNLGSAIKHGQSPILGQHTNKGNTPSGKKMSNEEMWKCPLTFV